MKKIFLIIGTVILIILTFFTAIFIRKDFINTAVSFLKSSLKGDLYQENLSLKIENENLKAQIQLIKSDNHLNNFVSSPIFINSISAKIFSTYPFNIKDVVEIDKGQNDGVKKNMIAIIGEDILFGQVINLADKSSQIRTIFDSNWQLPVKIGDQKVNGLFKGGNDPKITLIEKSVNIGDGVFVSSKDFPMNLKIGEIKDIKNDAGGIFKEAIIKTPYNLNEVERIYLIRQ